MRKPESASLSDVDLFSFLEQRRRLLDGVVFSGGEPLAQAGVVEAAKRAREMGFSVGLHTCGAYPERLREVLPHVDWVGLDVKAPWDAYERVTRVPGTGELACESLEALLVSGVEFETRTTWHPSLLSISDVTAIATDLADRGVASWAIQAYRHMGTTGELPDETVYPSDVPDGLSNLFQIYEFRRA